VKPLVALLLVEKVSMVDVVEEMWLMTPLCLMSAAILPSRTLREAMAVIAEFGFH
jgi:hypothetical protein